MDINDSIFDLRKSLDTSTTNGNNVLDPIILSKVISEWSRKQTITANYIKRIPWQAKQYTWDIEQSQGTAYSYTDGATLNLSDAVYSQGSATMSYLSQVFYITNPALLSAAPLVDLVSMRVGGATKTVQRLENANLFVGDSNNASGNPGLFTTLTSSPTFTVAGSGAVANRGLFAEMLINQESAGYDTSNSIFVVSPNVYSVIKQAAFNQVRFIDVAPTAQIGYAMSQTKNQLYIHGCPVVMDVYANNGHDNVLLLSLDPADLVIAEQLPITLDDDLAKPVQTDSVPFRIRKYSTLAIRNVYAHILASNVSVPTVANF